MRAVQGHPCHLDLWRNTTVWSRRASQADLTCITHLAWWSNPQTWGDDQGVWFGTDPWYCSERRNVRHRATLWRRGFQQCYHEGKEQHAKGFFLGCDKSNFCHKKYGMFWCGCSFGKGGKYLTLPSFSPQSLTVCDQNALKCVSPWGKQQRNRKLNYELLMMLQYLIILWKQWKVQWVTRYWSMHCGSLCAAREALKGLGCFVPGFWDGQT